MTPQQQKLLSLIAEAHICPSYESLMVSMGLRSKSGIHRLVTQLERMGKIFRLKGCARSIEVIEAAQSERIAIMLAIADEENFNYKKENKRLRDLIRKLGG